MGGEGSAASRNESGANDVVVTFIDSVEFAFVSGKSWLVVCGLGGGFGPVLFVALGDVGFSDHVVVVESTDAWIECGDSTSIGCSKVGFLGACVSEWLSTDDVIRGSVVSIDT